MKDEAEKWCNLPDDILCDLARRMPFLIDLVRLGAVCRSWHGVGLQENWYNFLNPSPIPWLMLADDPDSDNRRFFHPSTGQVFEVPLPEARGRKFCGSQDGWLVTMGEDLEIHLLNPLSREQLRLPPQTAYHVEGDEEPLPWTNREYRDSFMNKAVLSCQPDDGDCLVFASVNGGSKRLVYARPGDEAWKIVENPSTGENMIYFKDKFYMISWIGEVMILDMGEEVKLRAVISPELPGDARNWNHYLVEMGGELVAIARNVRYAWDEPDYDPASTDGGEYRTHGFKLFKLGSCTTYSDWTEINDLGDCCLFVGWNTSICLSPVPDGCKKNSIYFTDDHTEGYIGGDREGGHDMGVFNLDDGSIVPHYKGESLSFFCPPLWITLNSSVNSKSRRMNFITM